MNKNLANLKLQGYYAKFEFARLLINLALITLVGVFLILQVNENLFRQLSVIIMNFVLFLVFLFIMILLIHITMISKKIKETLNEKYDLI